MKIRWQLYLIVGTLLTIIFGLLFSSFKDNAALLIISEVLFLIVASLCFWLIHRAAKPIDQLTLGLNALKDRDFSLNLRKTGVKDIDQLVEVYNRMLDNIRKERVIQQEQHFFLQNLAENMPVGLLIFDYDNRLTQYNDKAKNILELDKSNLNRTIDEIAVLKENKVVGQPLGTSKLYHIGPARVFRIYVDQFKDKGFYRKFILVDEAGDEVRKLEAEAYGKVIRMMAHEVNNSVGAMNSILNSLKINNELSTKEVEEFLTLVIERNEQMNKFMENFTSVVRLRIPEKVLFNFSESVDKIFRLVKLRYQDTPIDFMLDIPQENVMLKGSREQLEQVLTNVLINAVEAIEGEGNVKVVLSAKKLMIIDSGSGITDEVRSQLFTPFFSTKATGQGIGLTLSREILMNHGFDFDLYTEGGKTVFVMEF